jgi:putative transposase
MKKGSEHMPRRQRIHVHDGLYFVRMPVYDGQALTTSEADAAQISHFAAKAASLNDALIHAYRWGRRRADLLIQVATRPLGDTIQRISGPFSQYTRAVRGRDGPLFRRYRAALVSSETHVLQLVRYIHWLPVREGEASVLDEYPWSSHHEYAGSSRKSWLTTELVRKLIVQRMGGRDRDAYARWMSEPVSDRQAELFETSDGYVPTRTGTPPEISSPPSRIADSLLTREVLRPIINEVCGIVGITTAEALSRSRAERAVLARALIARLAMRKGLGNLTEVARCLEKDPTALQRAIDGYSVKYPDMFGRALPVSARHSGESD